MNRRFLTPLLDFPLHRQLLFSFLRFSSSNCDSSSSSSSSSSVLVPTAGVAPLPSLLPRHLNPQNLAIDFFCSKLREPHPEDLFRFDEDLKEEAPRFLPYLRHGAISKILLRSQSLPIPSLCFFRWAKTHLGFAPNAENYCILAHVLTRSRLYTQATEILSELVRFHPEVDAIDSLISASGDCESDPPAVFGLLTKVYVEAGMVAKAFSMCNKALRMGFPPDIQSFNRLLNALVNSRSFDVCWNAYEEMRRYGVSPNTHTFNIMTRALCLAGGGAGEAIEFMEEMEMEGFDPDIVTYNTLVDGYCRKRRIGDALYLYEIMYKRKTEPDVITHTILMNGLCREGRVREAHNVFDRMLQRDLSPDIVSFNALLSGYCNAGKMKESKQLLLKMFQYGLIPDDSTVRVLVQGYVKCGKLLTCLNVVSLLRKLRIKVSLENYRYLVDALCVQGRPNAAMSLLGWMIEDGRQPDSETYKRIVSAFCECDFIKEAVGLKGRMEAAGVKPDLGVYNSLIGCLCRLGKSSEGEFMIEEMMGFGVFPGSAVCAALVGGYCKEGLLYKAELVICHFAEKFNIQDNDSFNSIVKLHCEVDGIEKAFEFHDKMVSLGYVPNIITCRYLIDGMSIPKDRHV